MSWTNRVASVFLGFWVAACAATSGVERAPRASAVAQSDRSTPTVTGASADEPVAAVGAGESPEVDEENESVCAPEMAHVTLVGAEFCIDRFECSVARRTPSGELRAWPGNVAVDGLEADIVAVSGEGRPPQGYINAVQSRVACERAGKRLCSSQEWRGACRGPAKTLYPYGSERRAGACNDRFDGFANHPVVRLFERFAPKGSDRELMWTATWLNDPRLHELSETVAPTASFPECINGYGVADMVGNLHEWVADDDGVFLGGFFMDTRQHGEGCEYRTTAHGVKYHDYSTGFRCCADVAAGLDE